MKLKLLLIALIVTSADAETTPNLIDPNAWELEGDVMIEPAGKWQDQNHDVIRFGKDGGTATQALDFSAYEELNSIKYGMSAIGCNNQGTSWCDVGTAYDELVITLKYGDEEFIHNVELDYNDGFVNFDTVVDPVATYANSGYIQIYGRDVGAWTGWYGAVTHSHFLEVNYTIPTYDPVKDDPDFLKNITGEKHVLNIVTKPEHIKIEQPIKLEQPARIEIKSEPIKLEVKPQQIKVEQKPIEQKEVKQQASPSKLRLSSIMQNITIDGVPASETQDSNSYNDVAQAVAISLLTAAKIKDAYIADAPFYNQKQLEDATLNDGYTGYVAINRSKINQLVDMQWQKLR